MKDGKQQLLSECDYELQAVIPILLLMSYYRQTIAKKQKSAVKDILRYTYIIEEPELHISAQNYCRLIKTISQLIDFSTAKLIFSTQNEKIIDNIVNNFKDVAVLYV